MQYGFSDRNDGSMHRHSQKENRARYFKKIGVEPDRMVTADLVHGAIVAEVSNVIAGQMIAGVDGLVTNEKNIFLSATGADCFIVYFYDPANKAIGIAHAGWRGLLAGVVKNTLHAMSEHYATRPSDVTIGVGPGIRACHFEISAEDKIQFAGYPDRIIEREGNIFIDLPGIIRSQLVYEGVPDAHIEGGDICTYCNEKEYFSYRRDKPKEVQVMVGYIGLIK